VNARLRRRGALLIALRGFRLLRQHYLTLVSAAIITALGVVAMSSDAFQSSGRAAVLPAILQNPPDGRDIGLEYAQSIISSPPAAELGLRSVVYFVYESENDRVILERGLNDLSRARYKLDSGGPEDTNVFVRAATPEEAAAVEQELTLAEALAKSQGYSFQVVDLRSAAYN
jgi:hypothetical protein